MILRNVLSQFFIVKCFSKSLLVHSGIFCFIWVSFRLIPVSFRLYILVPFLFSSFHPGFIPAYSGIFRSILFRSVPVFSNAHDGADFLAIQEDNTQGQYIGKEREVLEQDQHHIQIPIHFVEKCYPRMMVPATSHSRPTILDKLNGTLRPPLPPKSVMGKWHVLPFTHLHP